MSFTEGQKVEWWHEQRGGYGYAWWVPAVVVHVGPKRVTIDAERRDGLPPKRICVKPEKLREAKLS